MNYLFAILFDLHWKLFLTYVPCMWEYTNEIFFNCLIQTMVNQPLFWTALNHNTMILLEPNFQSHLIYAKINQCKIFDILLSDSFCNSLQLFVAPILILGQVRIFLHLVNIPKIIFGKAQVTQSNYGTDDFAICE